MLGLEAAGWLDAYRYLHGDLPVYTWYSPNGNNGFRLDQAFVHSCLIANLQGARYEWGKHDENPSRRDALSDHAALIVDLRGSFRKGHVFGDRPIRGYEQYVPE